jgi:hypothetical protein
MHTNREVNDVVVTCKQCNAENKEGEVICYRCGNLLAPVVVKEQASTRHLPNQTDKLAYPTDWWGTRTLNPESLVTFRVKGFDEGVQIPLETEITLGRSSTAAEVDVDLNPYNGNDEGVSRRHAKMVRRDDLIMITDLGSSNGTYINGQKVEVNEERIVRDGDELRLGRLVMNVLFGDTS